MISDNLRRWCDGYLDHTLDEEDARKLASVLDAGGPEAEAFFAELALAGAIGQALDPAHGADIKRSLSERLRAETQASAFVKSFRQRRLPRRRSPSARRMLPLVFTGCGLAALLAVALLWAPTPAPSPVPLVMPAPLVVAQQRAQVAGATAVSGTALAAGQSLTTGSTGWALLRYPDGSEIDVVPGSEIILSPEDAGHGKRIDLVHGGLRAQVSHQPAHRPLVIATAAAEAQVLGTSLRVSLTGEGRAELDVLTGRVRFANGTVARDIEGGGGAYIQGRVLQPRRLPVDEIILRPRDGRVVGDDWGIVEVASTGITPVSLAWQASASRSQVRDRIPLSATQAHIRLRFYAEAGLDYHLWIRGQRVSADPYSDMVVLAADGAVIAGRAHEWAGLPDQRSAVSYNGFSLQTGAWWIGGDADGNQDEVPASIRFLKTGEQTLRLYAVESPIRVDAIWLSTSRKTRPDATDLGPLTDR